VLENRTDLGARGRAAWEYVQREHSFVSVVRRLSQVYGDQIYDDKT
jgi:hypothetical protein